MSKKTIFIVLICIFGLIILSSAGVYFGLKYIKHKRDEIKLEESSTKETADNLTTATTPENEAVSERTNPSNTHADWLTYINFLTSYMISYPTNAKIEDLSDPKEAKISDSACVKISTDNYYVIVGKITDQPADCFRTGVGQDWQSGPTETVTPAGASYTITGMHSEAASAGYYNDFFSVATADGQVRIEYGISVNEKSGTISKAAAKEIVHQIVASYNPAE